MVIAESSGNEWNPAIAADKTGHVTVAWDSYRGRNYDVYMRTASGPTSWTGPKAVAASARYEGYPSIAYDGDGKLWVAYEEGGAGWGKDFGAYNTTGVALYQARAIRIRGFGQDGRAIELPVDVSTVLPGIPTLKAETNGVAGGTGNPDPDPDAARRRANGRPAPNQQNSKNTSPRLAFDPSGRMWLAFRSAHPIWWNPLGTVWTEHVVSFDGTRWTGPIYVPHSYNLLDNRPALIAQKAGQITVVGSSDGRRQFQLGERRGAASNNEPAPAEDPYNNDLFANEISLSGAPVGPDPSLREKDVAMAFGINHAPFIVKQRGDWKQHPALPEDAVPAALRRFVQQPQLAFDAAGHLYMALRIRTSTRNSRIDFWASGGRWETFLTHLDGNNWAPVTPMPESVGRNGMRSALALDRSQVHVVWATDHRLWSNANPQDVDVYATTMSAIGSAAQLSGGTAPRPAASVANPNPGEVEDVRRIRAYRHAVNGRQYRILRGDFHRHTELSSDGAGDGMLEDNYRYTLDAASMDIGYVSDHQMGQDNEYNWWVTQKSNDVYYMPQRFVPMYGYERSVPYPNGHRNVIWADRGKPVLKISPAENQGRVNTGSVLYPYLRETLGIATSHTSATDQGTDWRDNDPALAPVVEIYQGYDDNYEEPNAPRAWKPGRTQSHGKEQPAGYVWNAWAKGYKLGVQSSSDHISTHTSYVCVLAENFNRQGILDAIRKRHTYAATDNIIVDFEISNTASGVALMGDLATGNAPPRLKVRILGTAGLKQIDVIKNNKCVHQVSPGTKDASFEYVDNSIAPGESYYYVRVEQVDGQLAWSSPIWIRYQ